jgi:predicted RNase H-like HicB family nuclease
MLSKNIFYLPIVIEMNNDGYLASSPDIQGAFAEGDTTHDAIFNCVDVVTRSG